MFFCQQVSLQQARCADPPLTLPVITDGGPPIVTGTDHFVDFRCNYADYFGAVTNCAILTDQCLDGLCESFRRAGLPVHEITLAALSAETLGVRFIPSQVGVARFDATSSCLRKDHTTDCWSSLVWRHCLSRSVVSFGFGFIAMHWISCGVPWDSLKCELRAYAGLLPLLKVDWTKRWCSVVYCSDASEQRMVLCGAHGTTSFRRASW